MAQLFRVTMPKKEMALRVSKFCSECMGKQAKSYCTTSGCELFPIRVMRTVEPDQAHLFRVGTYVEFVANVIEHAKSMRDRFYFSDLRSTVAMMPLSSSWWGGVSRSPEWKARYRLTGNFRKSSTFSARGRIEHEWERKPC